METRTCLFCGQPYGRTANESLFHFNQRKFCSNHCSGMSRRDKVIERNKARRKYPEIEGLTRAQVFYRFNPTLSIFSKDKRKRESLIQELGGKCVHCGYSNIGALVLDHKNGNGDSDRKRVGNRVARYYSQHLNEAREQLQVLCANCNMLKTRENNEQNKSRRIQRVNVSEDVKET